MTHPLTASLASDLAASNPAGTDPIAPDFAADLTQVMSWILYATTAIAVLGVIVGGAMTFLAHHRSQMGYYDDSSGRAARAALFGGVLMAGASGFVLLLVRSTTNVDMDSDQISTAPDASTPTTTSAVTDTAATPTSPQAPMDWTPVIIGGLIVLGVAILAAAAFAVVRTRSHLADRSAADKIRRTDFAAATAVYTDVADQYAAYLADPYAIFTRPLLDDTSDTLTAAFIDAFADAGALRPDTCPTETARIETFRTAAQSARRAWNAADTHARKVGMGPRTDDEARILRRIRDALALALDDAATPGERENAFAAVHRLSEGLITVPDRITATVRRQLTGSTRKQLTR